MREDRIKHYEELERLRDSKLLVYITGDRKFFEASISSDAYDYFVNHLDSMTEKKRVKKITLFLYTRGGSTLAGWSLINLMRQFCDELEVIIPSKALSTGTLMAIGCDKIIMTKQAVLGPIDPSVNGALNPKIADVPIGNNRYPVSVEAITGFIELTKKEFEISDQSALSDVFVNLANQVHPLVLGDVFRARAQMKMLAEKLIVKQVTDKNKQKNIIDFLTKEAGSHDYTIHKGEAKELGLVVEKPDKEEYNIIKDIYDDIREELELNNSYSAEYVLGTEQVCEYQSKRALIESIEGGSDTFVTELILNKIPVPPINHQIQSVLKFDGWRHKND